MNRTSFFLRECLYLPNALSLSRLLLLPVLVPLYFFAARTWAFTTLYTAVALTDVCDGPLARRAKRHSKFNFDDYGDIPFALVSLALFAHMIWKRGAESILWPLFWISLAFFLLHLAHQWITSRELSTAHTWLAKSIGPAFCFIFLMLYNDWFPRHTTSAFTNVLLVLYSAVLVENIVIFAVHGPGHKHIRSIYHCLRMR